MFAADERRSPATLPVPTPAATFALEEQLDNCRDLAELLLMAVTGLSPHERAPLTIAICELSSRLSRAIEALQEAAA